MSTVDEVKEQAEKSGIAIPGWAIWVLVVVVLPWGTWVTTQVGAQGFTQATLDAATSRIAILETRAADHSASLKVMEATRFTSANGRELLIAVETRLERLEVKFDSMRRDLDRAGLGKKEE